MTKPIQILLSLPPAAVPQMAQLPERPLPEWVPACDPPARRLGSGGGTAHLLAEAWRQTGKDQTFTDWLRSSHKLIIHAGGQSRRLPAYAGCGKALIPIPVFRWAKGQRLDQTLLDLQVPFYRRILDQAPDSATVMVVSGDVLLRSAPQLPELPAVDVLGIGLWVKPEQAQHHGVFFCSRREPGKLAFFLHKPSLRQLQELAPDYLSLVDTGAWLLSERAVKVLMAKCGWDSSREQFKAGEVKQYELYGQFGPGLGMEPTLKDPAVNRLTAAVAALPDGEFYHFGTSRELIQSCVRLQNLVLDQREFPTTMVKPHPDMFILNARAELALTPDNHTLWLENAHVPSTWRLRHDHILTGIPANHWRLALEPGVCLDLVPVGRTAWCIRPYGMEDTFQGNLGAPTTRWLDQPAKAWFAAREITFAAAGLRPGDDIQDAPLFPLVEPGELDETFLQWLLPRSGAKAQRPAAVHRFRDYWLELPRLSARELGNRLNLARLENQREQFRRAALRSLAVNYRRSVFYQLDLAAVARDYAAGKSPLPPALPPAGPDVMTRVHDCLFRAEVLRHRRQTGGKALEQQAFALLREAMVAGITAHPARPVLDLIPDQIVWGRSPVRLDLAGGWTDTPPHCLIYGGRVVNVAAELNGQPPIQVFARIIAKPEITLRSIDLGCSETVQTYEQLAGYDQVGSAFSVAKAALALAGFLPEFYGPGGGRTLREQLRDFGGGIDLSLLAAVPKGSGLGTSSILGAAVLGTLNDFCGLHWDENEIVRRALVLEQLLTTGGGWQDQIGGITHGLKLIETGPGFQQTPVIRWLPNLLLEEACRQGLALLYYTGITRTAKNILQEIVRGMFLNASRHGVVLEEIGRHARETYDVLLRADWPGLGRAVARSWELNQRLDSGTNPPAIQALLAGIQDYMVGAKLLGAGGGGYLLILAKDATAASRIQQQFAARPPNRLARFVRLRISGTGMQVTRS